MQPPSQTVLLMIFQYVFPQTLPYDKSNINFTFFFQTKWYISFISELKNNMSHTTNIFPITSIKALVALWHFSTNNTTFIVIPNDNTAWEDDRQKKTFPSFMEKQTNKQTNNQTRIALTAHFFTWSWNLHHSYLIEAIPTTILPLLLWIFFNLTWNYNIQWTLKSRKKIPKQWFLNTRITTPLTLSDPT